MGVKLTNDGFICSRSDLNLESTLECGQFFRYFKTDDGGYIAASGDKICKLFYDGELVRAETEYPEYFIEYFDFDTDYDKIIEALGRFNEMSEALTVAKGLRILRQQPFETTVSFIISANNNIKRIRGIIERLCAKCGQLGNNGIHAFPTRESMTALSVEDYRALGCGFRSEYLFDTVPKLTDEFLFGIGKLSHNEALKKLCSLKGIGPKVAECILLFAYKMTGSYPVDTWIFKAGRTDALDTPKKVGEYYGSRYGELAGYAQQYIFEYSRKKK